MPLPPDCLAALQKIPAAKDAVYYFWSGATKPKARVGNFQSALQTVFKLAGIQGAFAHRFRDTFAVELLLANVPIERVSILLGHTSIRITEKHYTPWVRARQVQAEADVRGAWAQDPVALLETKGTPEAHGKSPTPN